MPKTNYNRYCLNENQLKMVLIRVDFSGVTVIEPWIEKIKSSFVKEYFNTYYKRTLDYSTVDTSQLETFYKSLNIPVSEVLKEPIHTFEDSKFNNLSDLVQLNITGFYFTLNINCKDYKGIDPYIKFTSELVQLLLESDSYIQIKRIAIRKIGCAEFDSLNDIYTTYEKESVFCNLVDTTDSKILYREYTDRFLKKNDVKVNYTRKCRLTSDNKSPKNQVILDMDGYIDEYLINLNSYEFPRDISMILEHKINDYLFELFKNSVTETYLKNHGHISDK